MSCFQNFCNRFEKTKKRPLQLLACYLQWKIFAVFFFYNTFNATFVFSMVSDYLWSILALISSQFVPLFVEGASGPSLDLSNQHQVNLWPKTSPLQSPRFFRKPLNDGKSHYYKDLLSILPNINDNLQPSHETGPIQYVSDMRIPSVSFTCYSINRVNSRLLGRLLEESLWDR